jgi:hypothetical protein
MAPMVSGFDATELCARAQELMARYQHFPPVASEVAAEAMAADEEIEDEAGVDAIAGRAVSRPSMRKEFHVTLWHRDDDPCDVGLRDELLAMQGVPAILLLRARACSLAQRPAVDVASLPPLASPKERGGGGHLL